MGRITQRLRVPSPRTHEFGGWELPYRYVREPLVSVESDPLFNIRAKW